MKKIMIGFNHPQGLKDVTNNPADIVSQKLEITFV